MMTLRAIRMRLRAILRRDVLERELDEELRFHIESEAAKYEAQGVPAPEARRRALASFGGVERVKEDYRDGRGDRPLADLWSDARYALRTLRRNPSLAIAAIVTLALGIGANVAIFSAVNAVILRPLPFPAAERLAMLWENNDDKGWRQQTAAPANMLDWQERVRAFEGVAGYASFVEEATLTGLGDPQVLRAVSVTGGFFTVLGSPPALGRGFEERETWSTGTSRVAVISHRVWRDRFGSDRTVVGRFVTIDGERTEIVGVTAPSFAFPAPDIDYWYPVRWDPASRAETWFRRAHWLRPVARIRQGVTFEQARAELQAVMRALETEHPETNARMEADLGSLHDFLTGDVRRPLLILLGGTGLLLLIACANVGNLMLVRAAAREHEVVLRRALGAARWRIVRQALTESAVLSLLGAAFGFAVGWWGTRMLVALQPAGLLPVRDVQPDARVFLFVLTVSALSAALFGMMPAMWGARRAPVAALQGATRSTAGRRVRRWVDTLVVAEVALALVLTVGAGLLTRSYLRLTQVDPGFDSRGVVTLSVGLLPARYATAAAMTTFHRQLLGEARGLPGVEAAALATGLPLLNRSAWTSDFAIRGRAPEDFGREVWHRGVTPDYFRTMGVPLVAGRIFSDADDSQSEAVVIINQVLAERHFRGQDPVGQLLCFDRAPDSSSVWRRIVGVVGNENQRSLGESPAIEIFTPLAQSTRRGLALAVRTTTDPATLLRPLERIIARLDPTLGMLSAPATMDDIRARSLARERFMTTLFLGFAAVGAILAIVGVYGVVAQLAQRRTQEIGIRLALGAQATRVQWLVVQHGVALTGIGVVVGAAGAALGVGALRQLLYGVGPYDAVTFVATSGVLLLVGLLASWIPARRATAVDPVRVLQG
jgi:putative ABC transport system permease protein